MWWHLLLECIEADESGARAAACRRRLVEERDVAVRRKKDPDVWLAAHGRGHVNIGGIRGVFEAAAQLAAQGRGQLAQRQGSELLVRAFSWMQKQRTSGEIPDMLTCWRCSVQLVSVVGADTMVTAVDLVDEMKLRGQRRKRFMGELALRWVCSSVNSLI